MSQSARGQRAARNTAGRPPDQPPPEPPEEPSVPQQPAHYAELECDVLVVGSGAGALTGAYTAASSGLRVLVIERTGLVGGTSAYSGAACWLPGSQVQTRADVGDSAAAARGYLRSVLGPETAERQDAFVDSAPHVVRLLEEHPDIEFRWQPFPDYFDAPGRLALGRSIVPVPLPARRMGDLLRLVRPPVGRDRSGAGHSGAELSGGSALIGRLLLALTRTGRAEVRTGTALRDLTVRDGRVTGAVAEVSPDGAEALPDGANSPSGDPDRPGGAGGRERAGVPAAERGGRGEAAPRTLRIRAQRGVLLAAGGFERNQAHRDANTVPGRADWSMAPPGGNTGRPIATAVEAGAATEGMDEAWWCPAAAGPTGAVSFLLGLRGGLFVDGSGARFANESLPYDRMGRAMTGATAVPPCHFVFDSREGGSLPAIAVPELDPAGCLQAGVWTRAETLDELGRNLGLPAGELARTVQEFNGFARAGVDERFHRGEDAYDRFFSAPDTSAPNPCLLPVDQPPYYAARVVLGDLGTKGGLRTDADGRVLRADGSAVEGLYAAGNTSASLSGDRYPGPGVPLGTAMTFGYRAVRHLLSAR